MKKSFYTLTWLVASLVATAATAQVTTTEEVGADGVRYRVTRQIVNRAIPTTEYQTREQKVYRPQVTTQYQSYQQTYLVPVTEYRYVPHLRNWWDPFGGAYWTNELEPVTRWEARPTTVQVPVARTDWVAETQTSQVPVVTYKTVPEEYTSKVAVSVPATNHTAIASSSAGTIAPTRPPTVGGEQYQGGDPPRTASQWSSVKPTDDSPYRR